MNDNRDNPETTSGSSRRDFLTGKAIQKKISQTGENIADHLSEQTATPESGDTVRLATRAMACEFSVILNPEQQNRQLIAASDALDRIHEIESQLTVYRDDSDLLQLNQNAKSTAVEVDPNLFALLEESLQIAEQTDGAFTPTARVLNQLWRRCRADSVPPQTDERSHAVKNSDYQSVLIDREKRTVQFNNTDIGFDLSGIGKGYALDCAATDLIQEGVENFLIQGGRSSVFVRGNHSTTAGWSVGIRHPLFPHKRLAALLLNDCGFSSSGSGVQFFRFEGKKFGHLFDPRTGQPSSHLLSTNVIAPSATLADALSTAFYVMSIEQTKAYCQQHPEIQAILIPSPAHGSRLEPILIGISEQDIFWEAPS